MNEEDLHAACQRKYRSKYKQDEIADAFLAIVNRKLRERHADPLTSEKPLVISERYKKVSLSGENYVVTYNESRGNLRETDDKNLMLNTIDVKKLEPQQTVDSIQRASINTKEKSSGFWSKFQGTDLIVYDWDARSLAGSPLLKKDHSFVNKISTDTNLHFLQAAGLFEYNNNREAYSLSW